MYALEVSVKRKEEPEADSASFQSPVESSREGSEAVMIFVEAQARGRSGRIKVASI
jgi:hypothetical protein